MHALLLAAALAAGVDLTAPDQRKLERDEVFGRVTCKAGAEVGLNAKRLVFCTVAKAVELDGVPVAASAYTLFHPNGRVFQTTLSRPMSYVLPGGKKVSCNAAAVSLTGDGKLEYCELAAPLGLARAGKGIAFHPGGEVASLTLDAPLDAGFAQFPAAAMVRFDPRGQLTGAWVDRLELDGLPLRSELSLHPNGRVSMGELAEPSRVKGHDFPLGAKLWFRADGTLERSEYVDRRGAMIHGEEWHDTRRVTYAPDGGELSASVEHVQSNIRPPGAMRRGE